MLNIHNRTRAGEFGERHVQRIEALCGVVSILIERERLHEKLREAARIDPLTGLLRRETFIEEIQSVINKEQQAESSFAHCYLAVIDLDGFREVNTLLGHMHGNKVIQAAGQALKSHFWMRDKWWIGRWGGDEFTVFCLSHFDGEEHKIRNDINSALGTVTVTAEGDSLRCSAGVVGSLASVADYDQLFKEADQRLYAEKNEKKARQKQEGRE